jgi:hypothetical protein
MNSARHKWLATVAKTYFASRETRPLGVIFWACELYLSLFWLLADRWECSNISNIVLTNKKQVCENFGLNSPSNLIM